MPSSLRRAAALCTRQPRSAYSPTWPGLQNASGDVRYANTIQSPRGQYRRNRPAACATTQLDHAGSSHVAAARTRTGNWTEQLPAFHADPPLFAFASRARRCRFILTFDAQDALGRNSGMKATPRGQMRASIIAMPGSSLRAAQKATPAMRARRKTARAFFAISRPHRAAWKTPSSASTASEHTSARRCSWSPSPELALRLFEFTKSVRRHSPVGPAGTSGYRSHVCRTYAGVSPIRCSILA